MEAATVEELPGPRPGEEQTEIEVMVLNAEDFAEQVTLVQIQNEGETSVYTIPQQNQEELAAAAASNATSSEVEAPEDNYDEEEETQSIESTAQILQIALNSIIPSANGDSQNIGPSNDAIDTSGYVENSLKLKPGQYMIIPRTQYQTAEQTENSTIEQTFVISHSDAEEMGMEFDGDSDVIELVDVSQDGENSEQNQGLVAYNTESLDGHQVPVSKKTHACAVCEQRFRKRQSLIRHMERHINVVKPHECVVCQQRFTQESAWRKHKSNFHLTENDLSRPTACHDCKMIFKNEKSFRRHRLHMHEEVIIAADGAPAPTILPYVCDKCPRCFSSQETLSRHCAAKHPNLPCFYCGKLFLTKGLLKQHDKEVHQKERPYACFKCWKRFAVRSEASAHLAEAHQVNLVRAVGEGRQKGDMHSTIFYEKRTGINPPEKRKLKKNLFSEGESDTQGDQDNVSDLPARRRGRPSSQSRPGSKRKRKLEGSSPENETEIPLKVYPAKKSKKQGTAAEIRARPAGAGCSSGISPSPHSKAGRRIKRLKLAGKYNIKTITKPEFSSKSRELIVARRSRVCDSIDAVVGRPYVLPEKTRTNRRRNQLNRDDSSIPDNAQDLKKAKVILDRLPESILEEFDGVLTSEIAEKIEQWQRSVDAARNKCSAKQSSANRSLDSSRPKRLGVKSIYLRGSVELAQADTSLPKVSNPRRSAKVKSSAFSIRRRDYEKLRRKPIPDFQMEDPTTTNASHEDDDIHSPPPHFSTEETLDLKPDILETDELS